jgi:geranylgeranyl diphosphate synthase, type I
MFTGNFLDQLKDFRIQFEPFINNQLEIINQKSTTLNFEFQQSSAEVIRMTLLPNAKRIRPALVYFGYLLFNQNELSQSQINEVFSLGMGLEMFHTFALIHDDIIDEGLTRRGQPTIEANYRKYFSSKFGDVFNVNHFACSATILAGDLALSIADQTINQVSSPTVRQQYYNMQFELIAGQIDDCFGVGLSSLDLISEDKIMTMLKQKSGNYSIQQPLLLGALLAQDHNKSKIEQTKIDCLTEIGEKIGLIFQFTDDILGVFGDDEKTGKSNISDIIEGKKTLLMYLTYQKSSDLDKHRISLILGKKDYNLNDIRWLKDQIVRTNALQTIKERCKQLENEIQTQTKQSFTAENIGTVFISGLSEYLLHREK